MQDETPSDSRDRGQSPSGIRGNPKLAIDKPQLLKQVKQGGGVDLGEAVQPPKPPTINIQELKVFWDNALPHQDPKPIEGEIIEDTD